MEGEDKKNTRSSDHTHPRTAGHVSFCLLFLPPLSSCLLAPPPLHPAATRQEELREALRQLAEALAAAERADLAYQSPQSAKSPKTGSGETIS